MSYEVNVDEVTQNWDSLKRSSFVDGTSMIRLSENKFLRLILKNQKYFVELIASGYKVTRLAGKTLQEAEKCYVELLHKIKNGGSMLEPY
jgi:hypothetical protein